MENYKLKNKIEGDMNKIISFSCSHQNRNEKFTNLHIAILKKYYNAVNVKIDYHRKRVIMDVVMDDTLYDPKKINTCLPTFNMNIFFKDLKVFLKSCLENDDKSTAYYAQVLQELKKTDKEHSSLAIMV